MSTTDTETVSGKWTYRQAPDGREYIVSHGGFAVALVYPTMRSGTTFDHDASLIAAAPELLEMVKAMFHVYADSHVPTEADVEAVRKVIRKAEGRGGV